MCSISGIGELLVWSDGLFCSILRAVEGHLTADIACDMAVGIAGDVGLTTSPSAEATVSPTSTDGGDDGLIEAFEGVVTIFAIITLNY